MLSPGEQKTNEGVSKKVAIILGAAAGLFLLLTIIFIALFASSGGTKTELEEANKTIEKQKIDISDLNKKATDYSKQIESLRQNITDVSGNNTQMAQKVIILSKNQTVQAEQIASLQKINMYLWIGGGSSLALGVGGTGFGVYELIRGNNLSTTLNTTVEKFLLYENYFNQSYQWVLEDYILFFQADVVFWDLLYDSDSGWSRDNIVRDVAGKKNTVTMITTEDGWIIAGVLRSPWLADGSYVSDDQAFLMSMNRAKESIIASWDPNVYQKAARLNKDALLEFGESEIVIYANKTGTAVADRTYYRYSPWISNTTFYAGQPTFKVKLVQVFQYEIYQRPTGAKHGIKGRLPLSQKPK